MSSFYDDASLVVIPSGYKTSKIYAEKPTDGSGDLTFTRASGATRVGANGLIEEVRTNLVPNGLSFNASTGVLYTTVTSDSPISGVSSTRITKNEAAGTLRYGNQNASASVLTGSINYTISRYFKFDGHNVTTSLEYSSTGNWGGTVWVQNIDIASTGVTLQTPTGCTSKVTNVGNGWYRVEVAILNGASPSGSPVNYLLKVPSSLSTGQGFLTAAPQLETGDIATNYIPTTTAAVSVGPVSNVPRLDYTNSSCPRLLLEPQRTNLVVQSNFLNLWSRFQNTTKSFDSAVLDPAGNPSSRYLRNSSSTALASRDGVSILASTTYTFSYYARKGNYSAQLAEVGFGSNNVRVTYNFDTNTFSSSTAGTQTLLSTSAQAVGNGWVRIALTFTGSITTVNCAFLIGDAVNNFVYIYGTQLEAGAYATSYIPTLSASVTRVADEARKSAISSLIGQTEGTIFGEMFTLPSGNESMLAWVRNSTAGTYGNFIFVAANSSARPRVQVLQGGVQQCEILGSNTLTSGWHKFALAYKANDFAFYVDGALIGTATSGSVPTGLDQLFIDQYTDGGIRNASKKQFLLFKTRLTNAQLAELTTL